MRLENIDVWFQDEARIGQQNTTTRLWAKTGSRPRAVRQQQFEYAHLFGAVCPATGATEALIVPFLSKDVMKKHLAQISAATAKGRFALVVMDGAGWHTDDIADEFDLSENILTFTISSRHSEPQQSIVNDIFNAIVSTPSALLDAHRIAACSKPTQVVYFESPKGLEQLLSLSSESKRDMFVCGYNRMLLEIKKFALK